MIPLTNIHTHTKFCDGINTVDEMVQRAIELGCQGIGFSSHAYVPYPPFDTMCRYDEMDYVHAVLDARERYRGKIDIFLGMERDEVGHKPQYKGYDYFIGSAHGILRDGVYYTIDGAKKNVISTVDKLFGGDFIGLAAEYYNTLCAVVRDTGCQVVGHFDLIMKFNENDDLFDENDPEYVKLWTDALEKIVKHGAIFEVNTGAIAKGYRKRPYPTKQILRKMREIGAKIIVTSDSHSRDTITYYFKEVEQYIKDCGYDRVMTLTKEGFTEVPL